MRFPTLLVPTLLVAAPLGTAEYIFTSICHIPNQMMQADSFLFLFQFC